MTPRRINQLPAHRNIEVRRYQHEPGCEPTGGPVVHDHAGIAVYLSGAVSFAMGAVYELRRGDVLVVPDGMPHAMLGPSDASFVGLALCVPCMAEPWGPVFARVFDDVRRGASAARRVSEPALARLEAQFAALEDELTSARPSRELAVSGHLSLVAAELARASPVGQSLPAAQSPMVAQAIAFIGERALDGISLSDVARAVARSPSHLAATMKAETGRTVVDWITHARLAVGRELLVRSDETVEAIAERVGFSSPSHFHRTFRRFHDATPGQWRALHRGGRGLGGGSFTPRTERKSARTVKPPDGADGFMGSSRTLETP